ncbi:hypothetical protein ATCC90586_000388 [Pythium insidiosum]|nr:hypothetical protein ATCC90586_000388 [Pythium insidiosum]
MVLTDRQVSAFNNVMARNAVLVVALYVVSTVIFFAVMVAPVAISRAFVWLHLVGQFPAMLSFTLSMRFDMLKLLCGTYNFWFLSLMNVVFMTSLCMLWLDVRILVVPMSWWEYQNAVLTDANLRNMRQVVVVSVVNIFIVGFIFFAVTLQIMPDMREALVFDGARRSVAVHEVTAHSVVTLIILLLRLAYRYRATLKNKDAKDNIIQCISYVCKVKPQRVIESPSLADRVKALAKRNSSRRRRCAVRLRLVHRGDKYLADDIVLTNFVLHYQRRLLSQLAGSFDVAFLSFQFSVLTLCVCDLFQWDFSSVTMSATLWLWIHWILTLDALLPIHRLRWGFRIEYTTLVLVMLFIGQAVLYNELMAWNTLRLQDRAFLKFRRLDLAPVMARVAAARR